MAAQKVTKKQFIEAIENNEDRKPNKELAADLDISEKRFYELLKRWRNEVRDVATEMAKKAAADMVYDLKRNSKKGDTSASKTILEIAGVIKPKGLIVGDDGNTVTLNVRLIDVESVVHNPDSGKSDGDKR